MKLFNFIGIMSIVLMMQSLSAFGQCPNNNSPYGTISSLSPGQTSTVYCMYGGEYATVSVVSGSTYIFSTCGGSWDSQLTLFSSTGTYLAYNDDACGLQSEITWNATFTGQVRVVLDKYSCTSFNSCMNLNVTRQGGTSSGNPCNSSIALTCGSIGNFSLASGNGSWSPSSGPWGTPGNEQVYTFTATYTGPHQIAVTNNSGWVDLFIRSDNGCNANGWNYIDDILTSATNTVNLTAGVTYRFLIDDENTSSSSGTITITCPTPAPNPCAGVQSISCDQTSSFTLSSGTGAWDPSSGPWGTPGREQVYAYTPLVSGDYDLTVTHSSSGWVDLFYKSTGCDGNGWNYIDDISSTATNTVYLTGGVTYYFLFDDEDVNGSSGSFTISCPCIGNTVDMAVNLTGPVTLYNNTSGACDDCSLRSSEDITYAITIPCAGTYTIETCDLASWDTYLYLTSQPCSGILASNDDNCSLRSSITYTFTNGGIYYVTVEGFSSSSGGAFGLDISRTCDMTVSLSSDVKGCGYDISCNGGNDGEITSVTTGGCGSMNYMWSNGVNTDVASGLGAGNYTLMVSDDWSCSASASISLTEPDAISLTISAPSTVYYGYAPLSCTDMSVGATGGCAGYNYDWSTGGVSVGAGSQVNVCPTASTDYTVTVTDQNGCVATSDISVCVVDVICFAGNSSNQKVEMCHVPHGNGGNAQDICIDASAVPAHLAHGCTLGSCDESSDCQGTTARTISESGVTTIEKDELMNVLIYPNPTQEHFNIELETTFSGQFSLNILNLEGKQVHTIAHNLELRSGVHTWDVDITGLSAGIYIVKVEMPDNKIAFHKIVKK